MADLLYDVIRVSALKAEFTGTKLKNKMFGFATDTGEFVAKSAGVYYFFKNFDDLETLLDGKEDSLGFTPENVANKENTTIDTSTVKYPTVNLLKTGLEEIAYPYDDVRSPTGFKDPVDVVLSYDTVARTVTITGNPTVVYRGTDISHLFVDFVSEAHAIGDNEYWLQYNGTEFEWALTPDFKQLLIALAYVSANGTLCLRECHGFIHWETHGNLHDTIGTYLRSGGDLSEYTLESTTAADRRPEISQSTIIDEDLPTVNTLLANTGAEAVYTQLYLSGADTSVLNTDNADIVPLSGNIPYYNSYNTGTGLWEQVLMGTNNSYQKIFVMATPASLGNVCQKSRYLFIQGQEVSTSLPDIQAITPADVNLGEFNTGVSEFVFIGEIIIRYTTAGGGAWTFTEVNKIKGTKASQVKQATGNYLSSVSTDDTIDGDGTVGSPLSITDNITGTGTAGKLAQFTASGVIGDSPLYYAGVTGGGIVPADFADDKTPEVKTFPSLVFDPGGENNSGGRIFGGFLEIERDGITYLTKNIGFGYGDGATGWAYLIQTVTGGITRHYFQGLVNFSGAVTASDDLTVGGDATIDNDLTVGGEVVVSGGRTTFHASTVETHIYRTSTNANPFPFNAIGNLLLQSRTIGNRGVGIVTGETPALQFYVDSNGNTNVYNNLTVGGATILPAADFIYWGDPATDGSWRQGRDGDNLVKQRREDGAWVTKETTTP